MNSPASALRALSAQRRLSTHPLRGGLHAHFDIICIDTEFNRLPLPSDLLWSWAERTVVLSLGAAPLSTAAPQTWYGMRTLTAAIRRDCTPFVKNQVLPHLKAAAPDVERPSAAALGDAFHQYLRGRMERGDRPLLLASDWAGDAYLIETLTGHRYEWLLLEGSQAITDALQGPMPEGWTRHNALHDAMVMREALKEILD